MRSSSDYSIAPARQQDLAVLPAIEHAAVMLLRDHVPSSVLDEATDEDAFREALANGRLWVALVENTPVGFAFVKMLADDLPHLEEIDVDPRYGRRGIGTALVRAVCEWMSRSGHSELTLTTFRVVPWNMPFYRRLGFEEVPTDDLRSELAAVVRDEAARGLDPQRRVAMRYRVRGVDPGVPTDADARHGGGLSSSSAPFMTTDTPQARAVAAYNAAADCYDVAALSFWERFSRRTVERLALRVGDHVLDVCCGSGASALAAAERVGPAGHVLGIDLAERLLERARTKAELQGRANTEFRLGDLATLDGVTQTFDAVICVFGIFFVPDMAGALARLWSRVRPGGVLAVTTWGARLFEPANSAFWDAVRSEVPALHKAFNPWDRIAEPSRLRALFDEAGVSAVEVEVATGMLPLSDPADWWTIVLGSGYRGTVEQLSTEARDRVRRSTLERLTQDAVRAIEANVLYAAARRDTLV